MKIGLRKVHYSKALSDESPAYSADIWIDGRKRGHVENHGTGGNDNIYPPQLRDELEAYAKTQPPLDLGDGGAPMKPDADLLLVVALEHHLMAAELRRKLRKLTMWRTKDGVIYQAKCTLAGVEQLRSVGCTVLNDLPFDEALAIFRRDAEQAPARGSRGKP
jgi:hypothetical protein